MLSRKGPGRHPLFGTTYYWGLGAAVGFELVLAGMRWEEDWPLALLGALAFIAASVAREARRGVWRGWIPWRVGGMAASYILMLTAFYVDNGKNLPIWRDLPTIAYWLFPTVVGGPIALSAMGRHRGWNRSIATAGEGAETGHCASPEADRRRHELPTVR
ncbi:MAG TPA: hypothetical protein VGS12_03945 [Caulobacteraceae bacterium]|nr:hypothetical protein [Caulobacteraceae bacterium]